MASFAGIAWGERGDGGETFPVVAAKLIGTIHRFPGGNRKLLHTRAVREQTLQTGARLTLAQLAALRGKVGTAGALTLGWGTHTALLLSVSDPQEVLASGSVLCQLQFRIFSGYGGAAYGDTPYGE